MRDRFLRACRRAPVDRTPLWIMRQAGRYLPEYRALKDRADFLTVCKTPELAVEASLQPLRRFELDASIIFSDIMLPLEALGAQLTFDPGPKVAVPIRTRAAVTGMVRRPVEEAVPFVGDAIRLLRRELDDRVPVIGFCGAPFTLAAYLVEGEGRGGGFHAVKEMLFREPATLSALLERLSDLMADYLRLQIDAGAQAVQLFDSWAGILGVEDYRAFALPAARAVIEKIAPLGVPVIYFLNAGPHLVELAGTSGADVLGLCWRVPLDEAWQRTGGRMALQGNLDPHALFAPVEEVRERAHAVLGQMSGRNGHIMNLGHGIMPGTPIAGVEALIAAVQEWPVRQPAEMRTS